MTRKSQAAVLVLLSLSATFCLRAQRVASPDPIKLGRIDAHVHIFKNDPRYVELLRRLNISVLNVNTIDRNDPDFANLAREQQAALELLKTAPSHAAWCSTFDVSEWGTPGFAERTKRGLAGTFDQGAVATKIWKNVGLELKSKDGRYVMPDDPGFQPIFDYIRDRGKTLLAHIAEPDTSWQKLDPSHPHYSYYHAHPIWHMYLHPDHPRKDVIIAARDRMLKNNPKLRIVGVHLGSLEHDVDEVAKRLDAYPNFAVDTAARIPDLIRQPQDKVRAFFLKYQDRILYGTDVVLLPSDDPVKALKTMEEEYARDWKYLATSEPVTFMRWTVRGLALPEPVLRKIYRENAIRWIPGVVSGGKR